MKIFLPYKLPYTPISKCWGFEETEYLWGGNSFNFEEYSDFKVSYTKCAFFTAFLYT